MGRWAALAAAAALTWTAWLAWDDTYQVDPVTGTASGPYEAWQVLGAVVTLAALAWFGTRWAGPWSTVTALTAGFTVAWSVTAAPRDASGLWAVGALLVLLGVASLAGVVAVVTVAVHRRRRPRS